MQMKYNFISGALFAYCFSASVFAEESAPLTPIEVKHIATCSGIADTLSYSTSDDRKGRKWQVYSTVINTAYQSVLNDEYKNKYNQLFIESATTSYQSTQNNYSDSNALEKSFNENCTTELKMAFMFLDKKSPSTSKGFREIISELSKEGVADTTIDPDLVKNMEHIGFCSGSAEVFETFDPNTRNTPVWHTYHTALDQEAEILFNYNLALRKAYGRGVQPARLIIFNLIKDPASNLHEARSNFMEGCKSATSKIAARLSKLYPTYDEFLKPLDLEE